MTKVIIAINFIIFFGIDFLPFSPNHINIILGLNPFFLQGLFWQPLTAMFMHANLMHLLMNMAILYHFGTLFEQYLGRLKFTLIYILGGILVSLLSFVFVYYELYQNQNMINMVGASGAICMLLGMMAFLNKSQTKGLFIAVLIMSFAPMLMDINVAWYAHIIGFAIGYFSLRFRSI